MTGIEWLIETFGSPETALRSETSLRILFESIVTDMGLKPVGPPVWHQFPDTGGFTGIWLLQESHLTIHTFPEFRSACLNVFCCSTRPGLDWQTRLHELLGATEVQVREFHRLYDRR